MIKINKMAYYAIKGMLADDAKNLELIISRLSFMASVKPNLSNAIVNGIAIDVKVKNQEALQAFVDAYYSGKKVTEVSVTLSIGESLEPYINITCMVNGKNLKREFFLNTLPEEQQKMFEIEYI